MIVTRTPLRISFVGGGSDRPSFYLEEPGACVAAAIDKYVYVTVSKKFDGAIRVAYSQTENVARLDDLQHELVREALRMMGGVRKGEGIEIHSIADIPGGTGLGSSSAFTAGLIRAMEWQVSPQGVAEAACEVELDRCHKPIGKQDQYVAAFGGLNLYRFLPDETVTIAPIECDYDALSAHTLLLYTGQVRQGDAGETLAKQQQDRDDVRRLAKLAPEFAERLMEGNLHECGWLLHVAWQTKERFVNDMQISMLYDVAMRAGAWGGKLCGAGGGGFLCFLAPPERHAAIIQATGLRHVPVRVGVTGSEVVYAQ